MLKNVNIIAGTHGNEIIGHELLKISEKRCKLFTRSTFTAKGHTANIKAYENKCRYIDIDLNRSFSHNALNGNDASNEVIIAKKFMNTFGGFSSQQADVIIDIHSTTSNMGTTLILIDNSKFSISLANYLSKRITELNILFEPYEDSPFLCSIAKYGFMLEMGPIANGVVNPKVMNDLMTVLSDILDFIELDNLGENRETTDINVYQFIKKVYYPLDDKGDRIGYIHDDLQNQDFKRLNPNQNIFKLHDGSDIKFNNDNEYYACFINEAAYYESNVAFSILKKTTINAL